MFEPDSGRVTTGWNDDDDPNQDTIALLQEEVARLEAELRARDDAPAPPTAPGPEPEPDRVPVDDSSAQLQRRVDGLLADLAERDEMVELLLEQSRVFEAAAAAQRAEWEQLHQWVDQVERRVEGRDSEGPRLRAELESERARAESVRQSSESDRLRWDGLRAGLEREAQLLRDQLARRAEGGDAREKAAFLELAAENRRLRTEVEASRRSGAEAEDLARRLATALAERDQARGELRQLEDERQRERAEHEAEVGALRTELAGASLRRQVEAVPGAPAAEAPASATDADERIRAFRQHLKELHESEAAMRADRSIASRLSRLWKHTGPG